jgi:hypothetical protein
MNKMFLLIAAGIAGQLMTSISYAHGGAGDREFPATVLTDDPAVKDEISMPTFIHVRNNDNSGNLQNYETDANFELDRRLTENLGIAVNTGYSWLHSVDNSRLSGMQNIGSILKYQYMVDAQHEFISSVGVTRIWGNTGSAAIANQYGSTEPTFYFGKGLGDLPIGLLRPLAITGTLGSNFPDAGSADAKTLDAGLAIEYSIPYLQDQVQDFALPGWISRLVPLIEITNSSPLDKNSGVPTTGTIASGIIYSSKDWQLSAEALLSGTGGTYTGKGFQVQLHFFLGELFPSTFGKPIF